MRVRWGCQGGRFGIIVAVEGARLCSSGACQIERRPRGASRAKLAPTFVSGQLFLWDLRATLLVFTSISRRAKEEARALALASLARNKCRSELRSRCAARAALDLTGAECVVAGTWWP